MLTVTLPQHWCACDALRAYDLLAELQHSLWQAYPEAFAQAFDAELQEPPSSSSPEQHDLFDDPIPF